MKAKIEISNVETPQERRIEVLRSYFESRAGHPCEASADNWVYNDYTGEWKECGTVGEVIFSFSNKFPTIRLGAGELSGKEEEIFDKKVKENEEKIAAAKKLTEGFSFDKIIEVSPLKKSTLIGLKEGQEVSEEFDKAILFEK